MSSAADMTKWLSYLLDVIKRPSGLEMSALRQLFTERILLPSYLRQVVATETPEPILHIGYDMGFMTSYYKGLAACLHRSGSRFGLLLNSGSLVLVFRRGGGSIPLRSFLQAMLNVLGCRLTY